MVRFQKDSKGGKERIQRVLRIGGFIMATVAVVNFFHFGDDEMTEYLTEMNTVRRAAAAATNKHQESNNPSLLLSYEKPKRKFERNKFTMDEFVINGVNLARYGFEDEKDENGAKVVLNEKYQLFDNFDIEKLIEGDEHWKHMVHYHRDLENKSLIFYMDKVAQKRFMKAVGYPIPKAFVLNYRHELGVDDKDGGDVRKEEEKAVTKLLPDDASYVVKPTHKSSSSGVWLVRYDEETKTQTMGYSGKPTEDEFDKKKIAHRVVKDLHATAADFESWALLHAKPGFVVEERYSAFDSDTKAAYEFKTFTIWGKVYFGYLKRGSGPYVGLVYRNGTMMNCSQKSVDWDHVPDWLQWDKVVELAEHLGRNKDMFRADIFVGLPSGSPELRSGSAGASSMRIAVSETEFHPTSAFHDREILEEASRLWMAGYKMKIFDLVPNTEVPEAFLEKGYLSEEDAEQLRLSVGEVWTTTS